MAELRKCGRCRSVIELIYFGINRKGEHNTTCITCLDKKQKQDAIKTVCDNCGCELNNGQLSIHKRIYYCQVHNVEIEPDFEDWLMHHDYHTLLWECKGLLEQMMLRGELDGPCKNCRKVSEEAKSKGLKLTKVIYESLIIMKTIKCQVKLSKECSNGWK